MAGAHTLDGPWLSQDPSKGVRIALNHPPVVVQSDVPCPLHGSGAKPAMAGGGMFGGALLSLPPPSCRLIQPERGWDKYCIKSMGMLAWPPPKTCVGSQVNLLPFLLGRRCPWPEGGMNPGPSDVAEGCHNRG